MKWESPKLSKGDIELITISLSDFLYYAKNDDICRDLSDVERILDRLEDHLDKQN
jgi:hypothetical protein